MQQLSSFLVRYRGQYINNVSKQQNKCRKQNALQD